MPYGRSPTPAELDALRRLREKIADEIGKPKPDRARWPKSFLEGGRRPRRDVTESTQQRIDDDDPYAW